MLKREAIFGLSSYCFYAIFGSKPSSPNAHSLKDSIFTIPFTYSANSLIYLFQMLNT